MAVTDHDPRGRSNVEAARRLYAAFEAADAPALLEALDPGFRGVVAQGMPAGLGGTYEGAERMLRDCWGRVFQLLDTRPVPEEYLEVAGDERVVVLGRYSGRARASGLAHEASFAHVLRFREGRVAELVQITDTSRWHEALGPAGDAA